ncbi:hypothetical protein BD324DRAFT_677982 [Kockovaella imperatae]|uniref:Uncharacterized protein n=1 Tax=Kockovaella imperatae TaxID=4999 RepID=A0A1Y1USM2_9TREE|nr:hypothetical protein BD324DRAFT_677982 [Kockovaella imperatae]ORX40524.1 hypothetical protein BD324DRAFT_677982 [Kockovaella imperatae]
MSLNSVVNNLVRAAAGIPQDISDSDLDAHVAKLLAEEAKNKEKSWSELGLSGLLREGGKDSPDPNAPKPNKRFLASVIRTVDGHNSALLRAQAAAARDARVSRGDSSGAGSSRLFGGAMRSVGRNDRLAREKRRDVDDRVYREREEREKESRRRYDTRDHINRGERSRRDDLDEEEYLNRRESRRREEDRRSRHRKRREEEDEEAYFNDDEKRGGREEDERYRKIRKEQQDRGDHWTERLKERYRERDEEPWSPGKDRSRRKERNESRSPRKEKRSPSPRKEESRRRDSDGEEETLNESVSRAKTSRVKGKSPIRTVQDAGLFAGSSSPPSNLSKMDKYFHTSYDPRLDLGEVPKEGMVAEVGWDNMLAVLKERGQKRRHQSPTLSDDGYAIPKNVSLRKDSPEIDIRKLEKAEKKKRKEDRRKRRGDSDSDDEKDKKAKATTETPGLFDIPYVKKGGVREWDVGK